MPISKKRMAEIAAIRDEDIDTSDIPELDERFVRNARLVQPTGRKDSDAHERGAAPRCARAPGGVSE